MQGLGIEDTVPRFDKSFYASVGVTFESGLHQFKWGGPRQHLCFLVVAVASFRCAKWRMPRPESSREA
jgi:hypothetical protein